MKERKITKKKVRICKEKENEKMGEREEMKKVQFRIKD